MAMLNNQRVHQISRCDSYFEILNLDNITNHGLKKERDPVWDPKGFTVFFSGDFHTWLVSINEGSLKWIISLFI